MATQQQPTPVLYGKDADAVLTQIKWKQDSQQFYTTMNRLQHFKNMKTKGMEPVITFCALTAGFCNPC